MGLFLGDSARLLSITDSEFPKLGLTKPDCHEMSWINSVLFWGNFDNTTSPNPDSHIRAGITVQENGGDRESGIGFQFLWWKNERNPRIGNPFPSSGWEFFKIQYSVNWNEEGEEADKNYVDQIRQLYSFMEAFVSKNPREAYLNYRDLDIGTTDNGKTSYSEAGVCTTLGVGSHISGGGYGNMLRKYGTTVDNLVDAKIVDAKCRILDRKGMGEDLFWAISLVVALVLKTLEENATDLLHRWQYVADKVDNNLFLRVLLQPKAGKKNSKKNITAAFIALFLGDAKTLLSHECKISRIGIDLFWTQFPDGTPETALLNRTSASSSFKIKSDFVTTPIPKDGLQSVPEKIGRVRRHMASPSAPAVTVFWVQKTLEENATDLLHRWQYVADKVDNNLFLRVLLQPKAGKKNSKKNITAAFIALFLGDAKTLLSLMNAKFPELGLTYSGHSFLMGLQKLLF
ncbi:UNVERIFIED_CONTAM: Berberine bridge enzyme-like 8 [Sesamum angustifolium]|uniref:Berberine bridge enzyme-like 8 n=1 Tax=Sesamum angustifolium TaxID=2727405 RepID=A0AAW2P910_9LAMI